MSYTYGTPITEQPFRESIKYDESYEKLSLDDINKRMSAQAMRQRAEHKNDAIDRVNGMKEEWGTGVSTRVIIYNALGIPLSKRSSHDSYGHWSRYAPSDRIEVGQWDVSFHVKTSGAATGSCSVVSYNLEGYGHDDVLMIGFNTPWSGKNTAYCNVMTTKTWNKTSWDDLHDLTYKGAASATLDFGRARVRYTVDQDSSPMLTVTVLRSDIGY